MTAPVTVTTVDRELASGFFSPGAPEQACLAGEFDGRPIVQAFARHRQQAEADSNAQIAELEAIVADAYYVLTYVQELAGDDVTRAACQSVRDQIDARAKASSDAGGV